MVKVIIDADGFDYEIRELRKEDLRNGFLTILEELTVVDLTVEQAEALYESIWIWQAGIYTTFVAVLPNGRVIGTTSLLITQRPIHAGGRVAQMEEGAVDKDFRESGVATQLLAFCAGLAKVEGCYKAILDTEYDGNYIESVGFRTTRDKHMRMNLKMTK
jgi:glucosamine-phosphate N-acetyltransferase